MKGETVALDDAFETFEENAVEQVVQEVSVETARGELFQLSFLQTVEVGGQFPHLHLDDPPRLSKPRREPDPVESSGVSRSSNEDVFPRLRASEEVEKELGVRGFFDP